MSKRYRLTVEYDHGVESPNEYGSFKVRSFNSGHIDSVRPDVYMERECPACDGYGVTRPMTREDDTDCPKCEGTGAVEIKRFTDHPDVLATLSYYEHGLCKWMVGASTVPDPYGGFDTVNVAGVLVWDNDPTVERDWFYKKSEKEQAEILDAVVEYYTDWANGNCYWYTLDELETCGSCGNVEVGGNIDSCGGFVGEDELNEHLNNEATWGLPRDAIEVVGEAEYVVELKAPESV